MKARLGRGLRAWLGRGIRLALTILTAGLAQPASVASHSYSLTPHSLTRPAQATEALNFVFILTDDQRWDTLCGLPDSLPDICAKPTADHPMPSVETELVGQGVLFTNAFASNPLCCPSRAGLLSGGYFSFHTNVLSNNSPNGGATKFVDQISLATLLQEHGYKTALIGKYLNEYEDLVDFQAGTGYVPPGWDRFVALAKSLDTTSKQVVVGSSTFDQAGVGTLELVPGNTHMTDYLRDEALAFLDETCANPSGLTTQPPNHLTTQTCPAPFFLLVSTSAPHHPAIPAPRHEGLFADFFYQGRGWEEQPDGDLADKPAYVQRQAASWNQDIEDIFHQNQLESLRGVDEAFAAIFGNLEAKGLLDQTVLIYASDNGLMWGEHFLTDKANPYEESIRVPLVIRHPAYVDTAQTVSSLVTIDLDVAPTILELAGLPPQGSDGMSLAPLLTDPNAAWRQELLLVGYLVDIPPWAAIRTEDNWKYVEYVTGEKELYDLTADPYELASKHDDPAFVDTLTDLAGRLALLSRGVAVQTVNLPDPQTNGLPGGLVGQPYSFQFSAWGGNGEYVWSAFTDEEQCEGGLPDGLVLGTDGLLSGTPTTGGVWEFCVQVQDTSQSPQPGNDRPQSQIKAFSLTATLLFFPLLRADP